LSVYGQNLEKVLTSAFFDSCEKDVNKKIPDQSGKGTHDMGNLQMLDCDIG